MYSYFSHSNLAKEQFIKPSFEPKLFYFFLAHLAKGHGELLPAHGTDDECHVHWSSV